jgi:hypothetical protein
MNKFLTVLTALFMVVDPVFAAETTSVTEEVMEVAQLLSTELRTAPLSVELKGAGAQVGFEGIREDAPSKPKESFFGPSNLLLGVGIAVSVVADVESTFSCIDTVNVVDEPLGDGRIRRTTYSCVEGNPRMEDYVERGRGATYQRKAVIFGVVWVGSHFLRKMDHWFPRAIGWIAPFVAMGYQGHLYFGNRSVVNWINSGGR